MSDNYHHHHLLGSNPINLSLSLAAAAQFLSGSKPLGFYHFHLALSIIQSLTPFGVA